MDLAYAGPRRKVSDPRAEVKGMKIWAQCKDVVRITLQSDDLLQ